MLNRAEPYWSREAVNSFTAENLFTSWLMNQNQHYATSVQDVFELCLNLCVSFVSGIILIRTRVFLASTARDEVPACAWKEEIWCKKLQPSCWNILWNGHEMFGGVFSCSLWLSKLSEKISQRWQAAAELNWIQVFVWRASAGCQNNVNVTVGSGLLAVFRCSDLLSSWEVESADLLAVKLLDKLSL